MKLKNIYRFVLFITVVVATFVSCSNDDSKNTVDDVSDTIKDGTWKVSYFYDSGKDETLNYAGYNFVFGSNDVLTSTKETNSYIGMWSVAKSTSDNDLFSTIFKISMSPVDIFQDLNGDWKVMENTGTSVKLKDDSKGETAIDYLTFEKIVQ
ncbi:hypothetical protein [Flavobacterium sp. M31R6]|uniref:hypothetical protein n=1 Tax=Flavobacterium sp. M31R6 TaxID=2739062 RepID=UPI0015688CCD|nr:hypothetical protein [Flavobacterium sp. M31R6]QKJ64026.1 hypothetical protein HQN62_13105 [Flavobacterium sp. M31R6]